MVDNSEDSGRRWLMRVFHKQIERGFALAAVHIESFFTEKEALDRLKEMKEMFPNYDYDVTYGWRSRVLETSNAAFIRNVVKYDGKGGHYDNEKLD